ncbi:DUF4158 domain-containing protein [Nocardia sp. 2YAB30]|uniref:DUF4158 domain-containing protein n=1 Tax=Nocardia sp. 2YAB30 TaxID=3233022 RepID=UPI003F9E921B
MASIDRTAYPRFKRAVSGRELAESFMPTPTRWSGRGARRRPESHLLALLVRLKCYQRLGYFAKLDDVPGVVVDHVSTAIGLADVGTSNRPSPKHGPRSATRSPIPSFR